MKEQKKKKYKFTLKNLIELKERLAKTQTVPCDSHKSDLKKQASVHAKTNSPSLSSTKDIVSMHASLKFLSRGQRLCASLFVALPCCHRGWPYGSQKDRGCVLWWKPHCVTDTEETWGRQFSSMFTAAVVTSKTVNLFSPLFSKGSEILIPKLLDKFANKFTYKLRIHNELGKEKLCLFFFFLGLL